MEISLSQPEPELSENGVKKCGPPLVMVAVSPIQPCTKEYSRLAPPVPPLRIKGSHSHSISSTKLHGNTQKVNVLL